MVKNIVLSLGLTVGFPTVGLTQTAQQTESGEAITLTIKEGVTLTESGGTPVTFSSIDAASVDDGMESGVTASGFGRYVTSNGKMIGQVVVTEVERNGTTQPLSSSEFVGQFEITNPALSAGRSVSIEGNKEALEAALNNLAGSASTRSSDETDSPVTLSLGEGLSEGSDGSDNSSQNSDNGLGEITPFEVVKDGKVTTRVTTDGCGIRVDLDQSRAFQQSKLITEEDGVVISESDCTDSEVGFPLKRSYASCPDKVDIVSRQVRPQFIQYYNDAGGNRAEVSDCEPDNEKTFQIVEKACRSLIDYDAGKVLPQTVLVYLNEDNGEVQVRGCQRSETKPEISMNKVPGGCGYRHDFGQNLSYELGTYQYQEDGIAYNTGGCIETGRTYAHKTVHFDWAGQPVCPAVKDNTGHVTGLQARVAINVDNMDEFITPCTPDTNKTVSVTKEGCENAAFWVHDLAAGQSYGQHRYYAIDGGEKKFITGCQQSQEVFEHQVENAGWQHDDNERFSYGLKKIKINTDQGAYVIRSNYLPEGATKVPFQLEGEQTVKTGAVSFPDEDCSKFEQTEIRQIWKRPDDSQYQMVKAAGAPVGPVNDCNASPTGTTISDWVYTGKYEDICTMASCSHVLVGMGDVGYSCLAHKSRYGFYKGTRKLVRQTDGHVVLSIEETKKSSNPGSQINSNHRVYQFSTPPSVGTVISCSSYWWWGDFEQMPEHPVGSDVASWAADLGWH